MIYKKIVIFILVSISVTIQFSKHSFAGINDLRPVLNQDHLAATSRILLSELLYKKGVVLERSGNFAGAVRTWLYAYNLDSNNSSVSNSLNRGYSKLMYIVNRRYKEGVIDLQNGRVERSYKNLKSALLLLDNLDRELVDSIFQLIKSVEERKK